MNDSVLELVAQNVRAARIADDLSLDALSARADVSKGALVTLEGGQGNPNFTTLVRLADALGRSVSSLLEDSRPQPLSAVDAQQIAPLWSGPEGGTARLILTNPRPTPVEIWRWVLHRGERHESSSHQKGATETLTVIRGQLLLSAGEDTTRLRAGHSLAFAADQDHVYEGAGRWPCEFVMTVHLPLERHSG